jgi:hypothetical protein
METKDIVEYSNRNWEQLSRLDREHWNSAYRAFGFEVTRSSSYALWQHMKSVRPEWPSSQDRHCDMEHHIKLNKLLDQASYGLSLR